MPDATTIDRIVIDSLFGDEGIDRENFDPDDLPEDARVVPGLVRTFVFSQEALDNHRDEVVKQLDELDDRFKQGWSFLQLPFDQHGEQWGEQPNAEALACLAIGLGLGQWMPSQRELWLSFPGGVPYFTVLTGEDGGEEEESDDA